MKRVVLMDIVKKKRMILMRCRSVSNVTAVKVYAE